MSRRPADIFDGFESLWRRVSSDPGAVQQPVHKAVPAQDPDETAALRRMIARERTAEVHYALTARLASGHSEQILRVLSADCRRCGKALQTEFFLRTGDSCTEAPAPMPTDNLPGCLRRAYQREEQMQREYLRAASEWPALSAMFGELARRSERRRGKLAELVRLLLE